MNTHTALIIALDVMQQYRQNEADRLDNRIEQDDLDALDRAIKTVQDIVAQKGCEHFGSGARDGYLTSLMDIVIFG